MELQLVDPKTLKLNPDNPRRTKPSVDADAQLTANIRAIGLIQPPVVRADEDKLVVVAGDRRVRCAIAAGLAEIHVLVTRTDDNADPLRSLAENVQRAQMGPVDQWRAIEGLCGSGWSEEAIGVAFSMPVRTIRKLRLLASILPAMLDRMAHDLPREEELRKIAAASLEEQAAVWKAHKPKRGDAPTWFEIARALHKNRLPARNARFDEDTARTFGVRWEDDLFGPADQDNRTTTDVEQFFAAQQHWLETTLPENGVILEPDPYGTPKLPARVPSASGVSPARATGSASTSTAAPARSRRSRSASSSGRLPPGATSAPAMTASTGRRLRGRRSAARASSGSVTSAPKRCTRGCARRRSTTRPCWDCSSSRSAPRTSALRARPTPRSHRGSGPTAPAAPVPRSRAG